ncbi:MULTISPECIES: hypothetical protein [unclassified Gordonia (in: high G+C Gram-positive bacteria)]|uniref:hypothetical protein n=1 Tax=unclassified Gordonia (in: high G+C Gram-positive bacteria) TaxID=2657482 RepID=UPI0007EBE2A4|nr:MULTISPECIES: hypothetical protein [unclassified Gordonia (in: high G+C Gram-positive bacteria)]OBC07753.1 hypothetical protein A5785_00695 [Gordonia sp. 852002-50395_SCH5434458]OBC10355.1 hypothetical protein A5786_05335 [Gordonia sp. 852002-50816_SCH5313054-a]OBC20312.1 hypothetical protein A5788_06575 [Gordonia sp. 852002-50816_SCH5313054-c]SKZ46608.1 Uncharacterised protein [Mycobacteroides abscessus subsp. abscessus]
MSDDHDRTHQQLVDEHTRVDLEPYGLPGIEVAEAVDQAGRRHAWLVETDRLGEPDVDHGDPNQSHECVCPLSDEWRARIDNTPLRCSRPTRSGRPCRIVVHHPGDACATHRTRDDATR